MNDAAAGFCFSPGDGTICTLRHHMNGLDSPINDPNPLASIFLGQNSAGIDNVIGVRGLDFQN